MSWVVVVVVIGVVGRAGCLTVLLMKSLSTASQRQSFYQMTCLVVRFHWSAIKDKPLSHRLQTLRLFSPALPSFLFRTDFRWLLPSVAIRHFKNIFAVQFPSSKSHMHPHGITSIWLSAEYMCCAETNLPFFLTNRGSCDEILTYRRARVATL